MDYAGTQLLDVRITKAGAGPGLAIVCPCFGIFLEPFGWKLDMAHQDGLFLGSLGPISIAADIGFRLLRTGSP